MTVVIGPVGGNTAHDDSAYPRRSLHVSDDRIFTGRPTVHNDRRPIIDQQMFAMGTGMGPETALRSDLVLLCGGTELERTAALAGHRRLIDSSDPVVVGDLQSLPHCPPYSRAVIVCGPLAGMSSA